MNPAPRDLLLHLLATKSFRLGDFKLSSGASSDYYIDCRTTTLHAEGARLVARVVTDVISQNKWKPKAIGGMTLGADPIVAAVAIQLFTLAIPCIYCRTEQASHSTVRMPTPAINWST